MKRIHATALLSLAAALVSAPVHAVVSYNVTILGSFGFSSTAYSINNAGQVCGISSYAGGGGHAFKWSDGTMTDLVGPSGPSSLAHDINDDGDAVGYIYSNGQQATLWKDGQSQNLGTPGDGRFNEAHAVNNSGQVAGWASYSDGTTRAYFFENGVFSDIGTLGGNTSHAYGINNIGQVVGTSWMANGKLHAYIWQKGQPITDLGIQGNDVEAVSINDLGQIVGVADGRAFLYSGSTLTYLTPSSFSLARSINNHGSVVGQYAGYAFLWENGSLWNLNQLISPDAGINLKEAFGINDSGQIVGYGYASAYGSQSIAFLLTPVPEPSGLVALLAGLGLAAGAGKRVRRR